MAQWLGRVNASAALTLLPPHGHKMAAVPTFPSGPGDPENSALLF